MEGLMKRYPILEDAEVCQFINGPESFTPDGIFNIGKSYEVFF